MERDLVHGPILILCGLCKWYLVHLILDLVHLLLDLVYGYTWTLGHVYWTKDPSM